jgi:hypothetical protein
MFLVGSMIIFGLFVVHSIFFFSMIKAISSKGYKANNIEKIGFISYDLAQSCKYIKPMLNSIINVNKSIQINMIGYGDKESCKNLNKPNPYYFSIREKIKEHKNIAYTNDGKFFLPYDPSYKIENNMHYFKDKSYFIEPIKKFRKYRRIKV